MRTVDDGLIISGGNVGGACQGGGVAGLPIELDEERIRHRHVIPARSAQFGVWPAWLPEPVRSAVERRGIAALWAHQSRAAESAFGARHTVISTGTASGKTLGYLLPVMAATYGGPEAVAPSPDLPHPVAREELLRPRRPHTSLYLAPTKALAHDQFRVATSLDLPDWRISTIDGDSEPAERDWAREHAAYLLTNPDMLHHSLLPQHQRWASFFSTLRYVVVDEAHRYRGMFGAHVAAVLRRLRRICAHYGSTPTFVLASATSTDAEISAAELIGADAGDVRAVDEDRSSHGRVEMLLWEPVGYPSDDAAALLADLVDAGKQTVAFIPSRRVAELIAMQARRRLQTPARIESYRGGYLAIDRRVLERDLQTGRVRGVASTNALELGVDISGLDAVVIAGFPGTRAALWQQAGRAGRSGSEALVVLIAAANPLDAYLFAHPELLFDVPVEATVLHADNPYVLGPHLAAAAQELPVRAEDERWFGPSMTALLTTLERQGVLRRRPGGWFWTRAERAVDAIDLRSVGGAPVEIIEEQTGRVLGTVDPVNADGTVHEGAVYLHQGETYLVDHLDHEHHEALVRTASPGYVTQPRGTHDIHVIAERACRPFGRGQLHVGDVEVRSRVIGYLRRDEVTGKVWDENPLELGEHVLATTAVWWTLDLAVAAELGLTPIELAGAAHGAEHTAIGLLPLFAPCDRWDIGGISTILHPDTDRLTVFVHDGHTGGAGFAERGFAVADQWWRAAAERLRSCGCEDGCPACVVSPKCGNANQVLDKAAAVRLLDLVLESGCDRASASSRTSIRRVQPQPIGQGR